jgi:hypothetical protein
MVSTWVRAGFTAYLLTTHLQIGIWQAYKMQLSYPLRVAMELEFNRNCFLTTYHPSFMIGWWVLV